MLKKGIILFFRLNSLLILTILLLYACEENLKIDKTQKDSFLKFYGSAYQEEAFDVKPTTDNGYILIGSKADSTLQSDILVIKTDEYGNQKWIKSFGGKKDDYGTSLQVEPSGGYMLLGTYTDTAGFTDVDLIKIDENGNQIWSNLDNDHINEWKEKTGTNCHKTGNCIQPTSDNGYIIVGSTTKENKGNGNPEGKKDLFLIKVDTNGNVTWVKSQGGPDDETGQSVLQKSDNGFILIGNTYTFSESGQGNSNVIVIETNANGVQTDKATFGGLNDDFGNHIINLEDGYLLTGSTSSYGNGGSDVYLVRISKNIHQTIWEKTYGGAKDDFGSMSLKTSDNNFVIIGTTNSYGRGSSDVYFVKTTLDGEQIDYKTYGDIGLEKGNSFFETNDQGFVIAGFTFYDKDGMAMLLKIRQDGKLGLE